MQQLYVLGIDIGTGSTKGVAVATSNAVVGTAQFFYSALPTELVFSEQDPEIIWEAFVNTTKKITDQ